MVASLADYSVSNFHLLLFMRSAANEARGRESFGPSKAWREIAWL
jgi:hypothetical protein